MSGSLEDHALVLRRVDYGESDVIVDLLTPTRGRVSVFARGARKSSRRFVGGLGVFTLLRVMVKPPRAEGLGTLTQSEALTFLEGIVDDPARLAAGAHLLALVRELVPEGSEQSALFEWLWGVLRWLHEARPEGALLAFGMLRADLVLLQDSGLMGALDSCARSEAPIEELPSAVFLPTEGVVDARFAEEWAGVPLDSGGLRLLHGVLTRRRPSEVSAEAYSSLRRAFYNAWMHTLSHELKTWSVWDSAIEGALREER